MSFNALDLARLTTRSLGEDARVKDFCCGKDLIDNWLWKTAPRQHSQFRSRVTTFHDGDSAEIMGFYALKLVLEHARDLAGTFDVVGKARGGVFPALHVEYLGVHGPHQGQGLGRYMMADILDIFCTMAETAAVEIMTLTPLDGAADLVDFYSRRKFVAFGKSGSMLIDAKRAIAERDRALEAIRLEEAIIAPLRPLE